MDRNIIEVLENLENKSKTKDELFSFIYNAILSLYEEGNITITAQMVKEKCVKIDNRTKWNSKIPAICGSMKSCVGSINARGQLVKISSENIDYNGFSITFLR